MKLMDFLDENKECNEKFEEWLDESDDETKRIILVWRKLRRLLR